MAKPTGPDWKRIPPERGQGAPPPVILMVLAFIATAALVVIAVLLYTRS